VEYCKPSLSLVDQVHQAVQTLKAGCDVVKSYDPTDCGSGLQSDGAYSIDE
jgi:hypothetical protein